MDSDDYFNYFDDFENNDNDNDDNNTGNPIDALERDIVKEIKKDKQFCYFLIDRNWTLFCDTCQSIFLHFFSMKSHLVQGRKK